MPKPAKPSKPGGELDPHITVDENGTYIIDANDGDVRKGDRVNLDLSNETEGKNVNIIGSEPGDVITVSTGSGNDTINVGDGEYDVLGGSRIFTGDGDDQVNINGASPSYVDNHINLEAGDDTATLKLIDMFQSEGFTVVSGGEGNDTVVIDTAGLETIVGEGNVDAAIAQLQSDFDAYKASGMPGTFNVRDSIDPTGDPIDHGGTLYLDSSVETLEFINSSVASASGSDGIIL